MKKSQGHLGWIGSWVGERLGPGVGMLSTKHALSFSKHFSPLSLSLSLLLMQNKALICFNKELSFDFLFCSGIESSFVERDLIFLNAVIAWFKKMEPV